ncbi:MAG TPA: DUF4238 domain-containing protein, partial [Thermoguttaceae bacterium]|nr:DUF4238 domain-containing protein [Thermoguttaceae bacterium]
ERTDAFERFLKEQVEDPVAPALKQAAEAPDKLTDKGRQAIALFIGVTYARTPTAIKRAEDGSFEDMPREQLADLDEWVKLWCSVTGREFGANSRSEFTKPSVFSSILRFAASLQERLLRWNWTFVRTTPERPFVTSDCPAFAQHDGKRDIQFVSFPISSSVALVVNSAGQIRQDMEPLVQVRAMNGQTLDRAREFVVCRQPCFLGDDFLVEWAQRTPE